MKQKQTYLFSTPYFVYRNLWTVIFLLLYLGFPLGVSGSHYNNITVVIDKADDMETDHTTLESTRRGEIYISDSTEVYGLENITHGSIDSSSIASNHSYSDSNYKSSCRRDHKKLDCSEKKSKVRNERKVSYASIKPNDIFFCNTILRRSEGVFIQHEHNFINSDSINNNTSHIFYQEKRGLSHIMACSLQAGKSILLYSRPPPMPLSVA